MIRGKIQNLIQKAIMKLGVPEGMVEIKLDHPTDISLGDYSTNVAMLLSRQLGASTKSPLELAEKIVHEIREEIDSIKHPMIWKVHAAAPGFINFFLTPEFFVKQIDEVLEKTLWFGKSTRLWNKRIIIEYTDPNAFKQFHIGHLMSNAIGESLSRMYEYQDAKVTRANYGSDIGLNVAKAIWGILKRKGEIPWNDDLKTQTKFIGDCYVAGAAAYEDSEESKKEIQDINKKIYEKSDEEINQIYRWGKEASFAHFEEIYKVLGSKFDFHIPESAVAAEGEEIVRAGLERGVFKTSEGAVIYEGEKEGLHNRVFINSQGLPTYEAKELGLTRKKFEINNFDLSVVITASEQNDYFKVVLKALEKIYPEIASRTKHVSHGMMRFASGKMSSRKGNVVTGESLLEGMEEVVAGKMQDRDYPPAEKNEIAKKVAVSAIKYSILKQSPGKDIIFDEEKSLSFEGDSGPYLQYTYVRAKSVLAKAKAEGVEASTDEWPEQLGRLEKLLYRFPEIVERASEDFAPNYISTYITELAGEFNSYYGREKIVDKQDKYSPYKVALTEAVSWVIKDGLWLLGIEAPERM